MPPVPAVIKFRFSRRFLSPSAISASIFSFTLSLKVQRPFLTPDECLRMPGPKKDALGLITEPGDMVVYCAGFPAIYGRQPLYFQDETFAARAAIPPPKRSDSLSSLPVPGVEIV